MTSWSGGVTPVAVSVTAAGAVLVTGAVGVVSTVGVTLDGALAVASAVPDTVSVAARVVVVAGVGVGSGAPAGPNNSTTGRNCNCAVVPMILMAESGSFTPGNCTWMLRAPRRAISGAATPRA